MEKHFELVDATEINEVIFCTHNKGKMHELEMLSAEFPSVLRLTKLSDEIDATVEEDGATYLENAKKKVDTIMTRLHKPTLLMADDSGLEIDALPAILGVHTNRFMGEDVNSQKRMEEILYMMKYIPQEQRTARFVSTIVIRFPHKDVLDTPEIRALLGDTPLSYVYGTGVMEGYIDTEIHTGEYAGFGYYPFFRVAGCGVAFSKLDSYTRTMMNHRAKAYIEVTRQYEAINNIVAKNILQMINHE